MTRLLAGLSLLLVFSQPAAADKHLAFIIASSGYSCASKLIDPHGDAQAAAPLLTRIGFAAHDAAVKSGAATEKRDVRIILTPLGPQPADAASRPEASKGSGTVANIWYKLCIDVPVPEKDGTGAAAAKVNVCLTQFDVRDDMNGLLIGKFAIRRVAGQDQQSFISMMLPGSAPAHGALVKIGDNKPIELNYTTCDQAACYAEAGIETSVIERMKTGKQAIYRSTDATGHVQNILLPLDSFAKAYDGPPAPPEIHFQEPEKPHRY